MGIKASAQYTIAEIHEECNVVISNESHVFRADKNNTAVAGNTSIQIYGYQGSTQIATTVGTISGLPSAGMTATISNNGKTNTSITVAVTTALTSSIANNGVLTIPITVAGKTFNKTFSWSKAQTGATGATGGAGKDGTSITISSTKIEYQVGTSGTTKPTGTWSETIPTVAQGKYLWTKTTVIYSDNSKTETYSAAYQGSDGADGAKGDKGDPGAAGKDGTGVTISSKTIEYVVADNATIPSSGWSTTFPTSIAQGKYLWTKTTVTYSDGNKTESYTVSYQAKNGTNGTTARTYWITSSANTVTRSMKGTLTPATITFGAYYRDGTSATSTAYSGRFIIQESTNGTSWTTKYTSSANESSKVYTPTATTNLVKCAMYAAGGTTNKLDELTIGIIDSIDDLEIGGRNFILNTKTAIAFSDATTDKLILSNYAKNLIKENDTLTLSFDAKASTSLFIDFYWRSNDTSYANTSFLPGTALTTEYQHFTFTSAAGLDLLTNKILYLRVRQNTALHGSATAVGTVEIKNVKLEKSTQASDWTPAPEDTMPPEVIIGTQTTATNVWTGIASFEKLIDGQQIAYWLPYAGTSTAATLNLTLADGTTTGAKNVYYQGTTRMTTHSPAGSVIHLTYRENATISGGTTKYTGWWGDATYNSDTYDRIRYNSAITAVTAISSGRIITGTASGFKHIAANTAFDINKPILYAGSAITAAATGTNNYIAYSNLNLASTKSGFTGTQGKTVYIVGTLNGTTFTPNSTLFTTTEPTSADGLVYIALGVMSSTTNSTLFPEHPLYKYVNGKFQSLSQVAYEAQDNLDNLSIGGRNYIINSNFLRNNISWSNWGSPTTREIINDGKKNWAHIIGSGTAQYQGYSQNAFSSENIVLDGDGDYTFSAKVRGGAAGQVFTVGIHWYAPGATGITSQTWKSFTVGEETTTVVWTQNITGKEHFNIMLGVNSASTVYDVYFTDIKFEKGEKATAWTPAPEDTQTQLDDKPSRSEVAENISNNIDAVNTTTDQKIAASIKDTDAKIEDVKGGFATQVDGVRQEVDAAGNVIRELENYATKFLITSNGMQMNIEKEKGANLIKNSVMIQHRDSSSGVQANYWDGFNTSLAITNAQIPNLASTNDGTSRANTDSGNYFSLDFTKNTSSMKYACLISNPVDFKLNASNILLSYKIRERSAINGKVFVGLIFYKNTDSSDKEISSKLCADLGTISTSAGFANARYVPVTEYSTGTMGNVFTEKVMYKTLPISRTQTAVVEESLPIQVVRDSNDSSVILEKYVTLSYTPDSNNSTVTLVSYNGTTTGVTPTGTKVPLELSVNNDYAAVRYTRKLSNYVAMSSPTSAKIVTDLSTQNATDIKIYYDSSTKKIWVFNPFTGTYVASNNLYSDTVADTDINTVRVVIGAYGSAALTGIVDFSDLKLEYDTISTLWSSHQNEIYGKEYKMDEYGFSITTDTNQMFIDEDEIAAYEIDSSGNLKTEDPVFQIKKENTILRRTVIHNELLIENETTTEDDAFIMKQQKVGSKWFYIFY